MVSNKNKNKKPAIITKNNLGFKPKTGRIVTQKAAKAALSKSNNPSFGAVSTITTAPVAIGNSLKGFQAQVVQTKTGVRVIGRDYAFTPSGTGTTTTWTNTGGMPLTPCAMPTTILRNFVQMYNRFRWVVCQFHYITSSPTSTNGDVMFYHSKNPESSLPNCQSPSFLPFVMSDAGTVLGPQWTNHTLECVKHNGWKSTDYGMDAANASEYSAGDVFLYSKTSSTETPGYVIFDYIIEFDELSINPRAGLLPLTDIQWRQQSFSNGVANTVSVTAITGAVSNSFIGGLTGTNNVLLDGAIYEFILDATNSTFSPGTASTEWQYSDATTSTNTMTLTDGMRFYLITSSSSAVSFFPSLANALTATRPIVAGNTATYVSTYRGFIKYIASINPVTNAVQY